MADAKETGNAAKVRDTLKETWRGLRKLRLRNRDFSLITNNCIAGIVYHDLGLPFLTPTINLFFEDEDFFRFVGDLPHYLSCEVEELCEAGISYPLGLLRRGEETVKIRFLHYDSFPEAAAKWKERAARVNLDKLYIIFEYPAVDEPPERQEAVKRQFDVIPWERKVLLTKKHSPLSGENVRRLGFYERDYYPGKFVAPNKRLPFRRYLDDFDYISFFNQLPKKERSDGTNE